MHRPRARSIDPCVVEVSPDFELHRVKSEREKGGDDELIKYIELFKMF